MKYGGDKDDHEYDIIGTKLYEHVNKRHVWLVSIDQFYDCSRPPIPSRSIPAYTHV